MRLVRIAFDTHFDAPAEFVRAWMTPFRTDEEQTLLDAPRFEIIERTERMVKSRTITPSTIELHEHTLETPMRWTRRSVIHEKRGGAVVGRIVATEEIVTEASGGCVFCLDKEVSPLDRRMTRQFGPGLRMAIATEREAYAQQARRLARRLQEFAERSPPSATMSLTGGA